MKSAYFAIGIIAFGLIGVTLVSLFGDITVTNQQDYTLLKNSLEAAMYDAIDEVAYKKGFCLCTNKSMMDGTYTFHNKNDYEIHSLTSKTKTCENNKYNFCQKLMGEIKLDQDVLIESFVRRISQNVKGDKYYKVLINEIVEYPPKVTIEIKSYSNYDVFSNKTANFNDADYAISNKLTAIFEGSESVSINPVYPDGEMCCYEGNTPGKHIWGISHGKKCLDKNKYYDFNSCTSGNHSVDGACYYCPNIKEYIWSDSGEQEYIYAADGKRQCFKQKNKSKSECK